MKKYTVTKIIFLLLLCFSTLGVKAQLRSAQWLDRMPYRYQLNPALLNDYGYVSTIPILSNINLNLQSNIGLSTFVYQKNDKLVSFLDNDVTNKEFSDKLNKVNQINLGIDMGILSFGFFGFGGYNVFAIDLKTSVGLRISKDFFKFMKEGMANGDDVNNGVTEYHAGDLYFDAKSYAQISLGHARPIDDKLTVGATLKVLLGLATAEAGLSNFDLYFSKREWKMLMNAKMQASGVKFTKKADETMDGTELDLSGLGGWGLAADLGATYQLLDELKLSLALTDLGFMTWKTQTVETRNREIVFRGIDGLGAANMDGALNDKLDSITKMMSFNLYPTEKTEPSTSMLNATVRAGAEYGILNHKITFGLLSTTRFAGWGTWTEVMGAVNFKPIRWFHVAFTGSLSNFGPSWGWVINIAPKWINIFVGSDYMLTKVTPQFVPVNNLSANLNFGLTVPLNRNPFKEKKTAGTANDALEQGDGVGSMNGGGGLLDESGGATQQELDAAEAAKTQEQVTRIPVSDNDEGSGEVVRIPVNSGEEISGNITRIPVDENGEVIQAEVTKVPVDSGEEIATPVDNNANEAAAVPVAEE